MAAVSRAAMLCAVSTHCGSFRSWATRHGALQLGHPVVQSEEVVVGVWSP